jgi:transmembrane sensor
MPSNRLSYLFHRYFDKTASAEEQVELMALLQIPENDAAIKALLRETWNRLDNEPPVFSSQQSAAMLKNMLQTAAETSPNTTATESKTAPFAEAPVFSLNTRIRTIRLRRVTAAAAVILLLSTGTYLLLHKAKSQSYISSTANIKTTHKIDVPAPNGNNAVLTLGDGSTVLLDSTKDGSIAQQGNASISKVNGGKLVYNPLDANPDKIVYNTISTRRGGQFQVVLPDGSKVWLNTLSSIRFPTTFRCGERTVELTGEAYFEITKKCEQPFKVHIVSKTGGDGMDIQVLGTDFNVMAYTNENEIKTTLLDGAIKVLKGQVGTILAPGEQIKLNNQGEFNLDKHADTELALAWKNGSTAFKGADIQSIMRQVERWYDIDVAYEGHIPERTFTGAIPRNSNLSELVRLLEVSKINFKLEGKKLTVMP